MPSVRDANPTGASEYNFYGVPTTEGATYSWEFVPADGSGATLTAEGQCVSRKSLPSGRWIVKLRVSSASGDSVAYSEVSYGQKSLAVTVSATPLSLPAATMAEFSSVVS